MSFLLLSTKNTCLFNLFPYVHIFEIWHIQAQIKQMLWCMSNLKYSIFKALIKLQLI